MILVTGATGHLGRATIDALLKTTTGNNIVAFTRNEEKAADLKAKGIEIRTGNLDDKASVEAAMKGIEKVLLISGTDPNRREQHKQVIDAAKDAGVKQIVYTGVTLTNVKDSVMYEFMNDHFATEEYIQASGIPYTFLRNTLYLDGIPRFAGEGLLEQGITLPSGNGKVAYALRKEMGEAAAKVLATAGHENKTYHITGSELYSYSDVIDALNELSGKNLIYTDADPTEFNAFLKEIGVPEFGIFIVEGFSTDIKNGLFEKTSPDLEMLIGRKPTGLKDGLKELLNL